jgi:hypothetical protein
MKPFALALLAAALPAAAHDTSASHDDLTHQERTISAASQLAPWCRAEAEAIVIARGGTPYQWTASYHDRGKLLHVEGRLRVDGEDVSVQCRIARGARESHATIEFGATDA